MRPGRGYRQSGVRLTSRGLLRGCGRALALAGLSSVLAGCESDSFIDPSVVGRWENTPTIVPILERIDVIERDTGEFVDVTPVMPEDLLPEATEYRAGPGDVLTITIFDFYQSGAPAEFQQFVDSRGYITLPQLGEVFVNKMTKIEIQGAIVQAVRDAGLLDSAIVDVQIPGARQATFSIFGLVDRVGRYAVPGPEYRLLEAITDAGGVSPSIEKVFIIRQVTLTEEPPAPAGTKPPPRSTPAQPSRSKSPEDGKSLIDLINELTEPEESPAPPPARVRPVETPSADPNLESLLEPEDRGSDPSTPPSPGVIGTGRTERAAGSRPAAAPSMAAMRRSNDPPIDLIDQESPVLPPIAPANGSSNAVAGQGRWVFLNGEWRQVIQEPTARREGLPEGGDPLKSAPKGNEVVTQRVIEVPVAPLIQGVAQYNLVVRAGDAISVPGPRQGFIYLSGPGILRPGVYQLPFTGKLTLQRLIASAGGLGPVAIPERVDLTRMVGNDRQATIRLNLRAIAEGTQPDIFLKPDDLINVGTNFWATPLAVLRGGLRVSYGFGFLLDRNFGNDVFGPPPSDNRF